MSLYETLMAVLTITKIVYDILSDLLRRRKKETE